MKMFKVKINDEVYEVEVEEMEAGSTVKENKKDTAPKAESAANKTKEKVEGKDVLAPLPGNLSLEVSEGDSVAEGDVIFVLEAMKMENDITAPAGGTIKAIYVNDGDSVETGDVLATIA